MAKPTELSFQDDFLSILGRSFTKGVSQTFHETEGLLAQIYYRQDNPKHMGISTIELEFVSGPTTSLNSAFITSAYEFFR